MPKVAIGLALGALTFAVTLALLLLRDEKFASPAAVATATPEPERTLDADIGHGSAQTVVLALATSPAGTIEREQSSPGAGPRPMPIRLEFEAVLTENPAVAASHAAMELEPRDPVWAARMEDTFRRAFAANVDLNRYGSPSAECRSTRCEIQMLAYGAPSMERTQWGTLLGKGLMDTPVEPTDDFVGGTPLDFSFGSKVVDGTTALVFNVFFARPGHGK